MSRTIERNCFRRFGCDFEQATKANDGLGLNDPGSMAHAFDKQRRNALVRGVDWRITLPEWASIWRDSGKWALRGRTAGSYVMGRNRDVGPYAAWNVSIVPVEVNNRAAVALAKVDLGRCGRLRRGTGKGWTFRKDQPLHPYWVRCGDRIVGSFATQAEAEAAYAAAV